MRQLPIDIINERNIGVVVELLPWNNQNLSVYNDYRVVDKFDSEVIRSIKNCFIHTNIEKELWPQYMENWLNLDFQIYHLPYAGNLFNIFPNNFTNEFDVCFEKMPDSSSTHIQSILNRLDFLKLSSCEYLRGMWFMCSSSKVCLKFHEDDRLKSQTHLDESIFDIQLWGGLLLTDMELASKYFGENIGVAKSTTQFIQMMENGFVDNKKRFELISCSIKEIACHQTYFNRLKDIFLGLEENKEASFCETEGFRLANIHIWEMEARLNCAKEGRKYGSFVAQIV
jgi:hypothetical protein